jgi:pyridoxal phosphate-dependent aminotransferase EpsN
MTSSGGGMALSNNQIAIEKMRFWSMQAREPAVHYEHKEYGYNYRMSNICACIGRGQLEFMPEKLRMRKKIYDTYRREMQGLPAHIKQSAQKGANHWLNLLVLEGETITPEEVVGGLQDAGIEARPAWKPMHMQPLFSSEMFFSHYGDHRPGVGESVFGRAVCLPSGDGMSEEQQQTVAGALKAVLDTGARAVHV